MLATVAENQKVWVLSGTPLGSVLTEVTTEAEAAKFAQSSVPMLPDATSAAAPTQTIAVQGRPSPTRESQVPMNIGATRNSADTAGRQPSQYRSEIRSSQINQLTERVRERNYERYLRKVVLAEVRGFHGEVVEFDFPVTAIVGPNGGGKTTILGAAALAYTSIKPRQFFAKSGTFDASMLNWRIEWELIDRSISRRDTFRRTATFKSSKWYRDKLERPAVVFGVSRTVPASERIELRKCASNHFSVPKERIAQLTPAVIDAAE